MGNNIRRDVPLERLLLERPLLKRLPMERLWRRPTGSSLRDIVELALMILLASCASPTPLLDVELTATAQSQVTPSPLLRQTSTLAPSIALPPTITPTANRATTPSKSFTPTIDGVAAPDEWSRASLIKVDGAIISALYYGADAQNIYARVDAKADWKTFGDVAIGLYISSPRLKESLIRSHFGNDLGLNATTLSEVLLIQGGGYFGANYKAERGEWKPTETLQEIGVKGNVLEFALPLMNLGDVVAGDEVKLIVVISKDERDVQRVPLSEAGKLVITK